MVPRTSLCSTAAATTPEASSPVEAVVAPCKQVRLWNSTRPIACCTECVLQHACRQKAAADLCGAALGTLQPLGGGR